MCEPVEAVVFAGGGTTVPNETFVPAAPATHFQSPNALFHAPNGTLYVSDHGTRSVFAVETRRTYLITKPPSVSGGESFDTDNDHVLESPTPSPRESPSKDDQNAGFPKSSPRRCISTTSLLDENHVQNPYGLVSLADGTMLVADMRDNTIKRINGDKVSVFAGSGERGSSDGKFNMACFDKPKALCVTPRGDLLVSEVGSHRIRLLIMDYGGIVVTVAGQGPKGYREGAAEQSQFSHPSGICCSKVDEILSLLTYRPSDSPPTDDNVPPFNADIARSTTNENEHEVRVIQGASTLQAVRTIKSESNFDDLIIFVSDTNNHRVRAIFDGFVFSLAGNGTRGMADGPGNLAQFNHPAQVCMAHHAILVADTRNDRIRYIDLVTNLVSTVPTTTNRAIQLPPNAFHFTEPEQKMEDRDEKKEEALVLKRPNALCLNNEGELFVSAQVENAAVIVYCSKFVPPKRDTPISDAPESKMRAFEATHMYLRPESASPQDDESVESRTERRDSVSVQVSEDVQEQIQLLQDVKRASFASPGGHIQNLVERERSRSVDAGVFAFVSEGSQEMRSGLALPKIDEEEDEASFASRWSPWSLWNRLTRLLSADEGTLIPRDDSGLNIVGRDQRDEEMRTRDAVRMKKIVKDSSSLSEEIRDLRVDELPEVGGSEFKRLGTKRMKNKKREGKDSIEEASQLESRELVL